MSNYWCVIASAYIYNSMLTLNRAAPGATAFIGLGAYTYYTGMRNLRRQEKAIMASPTKYKLGSRQLAVATLSASLVGLGLYRAFN